MNTNPVWPGWETVGLIGRGSFGAVYEIQRDVLGDVEKAALKVISLPQNSLDIDEMYNDGYDDESITSTFQSHLKSIVAEYTLMRKMNGHSNIVSCDDIRYVQHEDGFGWDIFIKMELLTPLSKTLPLKIPEETVVQVAIDMCAALEVCQKHSIIHRDIKPQNIFLSPNGDYKLGDFGIAKTVEKTMGGTQIGTFKYMAPEVFHNQPFNCTVDIYSLGLVLYWMLNEKRMPFMPLPPAKLGADMESEARLRRFNGEQLPPPAHGSKQLQKIVLKACAFDPNDRYQSATEMLAVLKETIAPVPPIPITPPVPENLDVYLEKHFDQNPQGIVVTVKVGSNNISVTMPEKLVDGQIVSFPGCGLRSIYNAETVGNLHIKVHFPTKPSPFPPVNPKARFLAVLPWLAIVFGLLGLLLNVGKAGALIWVLDLIWILVICISTAFLSKGKRRRTLLVMLLLIILLIVKSCVNDCLAPFKATEQGSDASITPEETKPKVTTPLEPQTSETFPAEWSQWSDVLPPNVNTDNCDIEEQTLYRSREMNFTTSTSTKELDGWEHYNTIYNGGGYGPWSDWNSAAVSATSSRDVETQERYRYRDMETSTGTTSSKDGWTLYNTTYSWSNYGSWSSWSTSYVSGSDSRQVESKTQYRYRSISVSQEYTDWGSWSAWSDTPVSSNNDTKVETRTVYGYYYFLCPKCGAHMHGYPTCYTWAGGCGKDTMNTSNFVYFWSTISWSNAGFQDWHGTGKLYTNAPGTLCFKWSDNGQAKTQYRYATRSLQNVTNYGSWSSWSDSAVSETSSRDVETRTVYRYRDRSQIATYHFQRWGSWSNWSATAVSSTNTRQVETSTFYRYRDAITQTTYCFRRWSDWSEYSLVPAEASENIEVEAKIQYRYRGK